MIWRVEKFDWITATSVAMNSTALKDCAEICLDAGGFLTGSFGRAVAICALQDTGKLSFIDEPPVTWKNLGASYVGNHPAYTSKLAGDIDFFFPTEEIGDAAVQALSLGGEKHRLSDAENMHEWFRKSSAGFATEFFLRDGLMFQLITKNVGTPREVTDSFDISNAKVYLTRGEIHYTDEWLKLEQDRELGIHRVDKPNLVWRGYKWFNRGAYNGFSEGSDSKYVDAVMLEAKRLHEAQAARNDQKVSTNVIRIDAKATWPTWELIQNRKITLPKTLLKASYLFDGYKNLEIIRRVREEIQRRNP